jgi:hypothetical protein
MSQILWSNFEREEGVDLGDVFLLLQDFSLMAKAAGGETDPWPDLFDVPNLTMEGDDVDPETLANIRAQSKDFLERHGGQLDENCQSILTALLTAGHRHVDE